MAIIQTDKTANGQALSYEIFDDGYMIYLAGNPWVKQRGKYGKPYKGDGTYEENCLLQIEEITKPVEPEANPIQEQVEQNTAAIEYIALVSDIELEV